MKVVNFIEEKVPGKFKEYCYQGTGWMVNTGFHCDFGNYKFLVNNNIFPYYRNHCYYGLSYVKGWHLRDQEQYCFNCLNQIEKNIEDTIIKD